MTDELSDLIRRATKRGNMTHLSVVSSDGITFKAAWRGVDDKDHRMVESPDIVDALVCALTGRKPIAAVVEKKVRMKRQRAQEAGFDDILG
jgi:hypothetical protein